MFIVFMETPQYRFMLAPWVACYARQPWAIKSIPQWGGIFFTNPANILCRCSPLLGEGLGVRL